MTHVFCIRYCKSDFYVILKLLEYVIQKYIKNKKEQKNTQIFICKCKLATANSNKTNQIVNQLDFMYNKNDNKIICCKAPAPFRKQTARRRILIVEQIWTHRILKKLSRTRRPETSKSLMSKISN